MRSKRILRALAVGALVTAIAVLWSAPAAAGNTLDVTAPAALEGSYGLAVTIDGSTNKAFVRDSSPVDEHVYRATFLIDMNNLTMTDLDWHFVATFRAEVGGPDAYPTPRNLMRILVRYRAGQANPFKIRFVARNDNMTWNQPGGHSLETSGVSVITVEWQAASGPGANDGFARFYRNGILRAEATGMDNDEWAGIGSATLGVDQIDAGTSGTMYYDGFESYRTLLP